MGEQLSEFFVPQRDLDTVVFVHGLGGHYRDTWGEFPDLLASDPDLPKLDILLWGYVSGVQNGSAAGIATVGGELISDLSVHVQSDNAIHLVGHSLGGLVILNGFADEMAMGRAQTAPTSNVSFISLFASPVSGSSAAAVIKHTLGKLKGVGSFLVNKQIREVARGTDVDDLLTKVVDRMYAPETEDGSHRAIPIRMVMANRDHVVDVTDRERDRARFTRCTPLAFDYDHWTIKEPKDHNDRRYRALSSDVQAGLSERFHRICTDLLDGMKEVQESAVVEFVRRYEHIFRRRLEEHGVDVDAAPALYRSYLRLIVKDCKRAARPPFYAADRALTFLKERGVVRA